MKVPEIVAVAVVTARPHSLTMLSFRPSPEVFVLGVGSTSLLTNSRAGENRNCARFVPEPAPERVTDVSAWHRPSERLPMRRAGAWHGQHAGGLVVPGTGARE